MAITLSDPPFWKNNPGATVATPLTVCGIVEDADCVVLAVTFVTAFPEAL